MKLPSHIFLVKPIRISDISNHAIWIVSSEPYETNRLLGVYKLIKSKNCIIYKYVKNTTMEDPDIYIYKELHNDYKNLEKLIKEQAILPISFDSSKLLGILGY